LPDPSALLRASLVGTLLRELFPEEPELLRAESPFQLLVSVVLSARCTDQRVERVTPRLFALAPTAAALAELSRETVEDCIHSLGFFRQKARALHGLARRLVDDFSGRVPLNFPDLESLPGVGHKTASVVLGQCAAMATFPVDTHVARLAVRWELARPGPVEKIERDLKAVFCERDWMATHRRMIAWGRSGCRARGCDGARCSICRRLKELSHGPADSHR
jgi:endonuclease-3